MAFLGDKLHKLWNPPEDEYEDYEDEQINEAPRRIYDRHEEEAPKRNFSSFSSGSRSTQENKIVNIRAQTQLQVVLFKPVSFGEETRNIADQLIERHTVVLNLEKTEKDNARRIVDFLSGVAYANNGKIKRVATNTFIITPYNVDLTGDDVLDELENSGVYF